MTKTLPPNETDWASAVTPYSSCRLLYPGLQDPPRQRPACPSQLACKGLRKLTKIAARMELSKPVHSSATRGCSPNSPLILSEFRSGESARSSRIVWTVGTSVLANSSREATRSVMAMGVQPAAWAARRVTRPIGPAPLRVSQKLQVGAKEGVDQKEIKTLSRDGTERGIGYAAHQMTMGSPRLMPARSIPAKATARGSHTDPSSNETLSGSLWSHAAGWAWNRVNVPWYGGVEKNTTRGPGAQPSHQATSHAVQTHKRCTAPSGTHRSQPASTARRPRWPPCRPLLGAPLPRPPR